MDYIALLAAVSSWLPPASNETAGTEEGGHVEAIALLAAVSSWLPPASNETVPCVEVRLADAPGQDGADHAFALQDEHSRVSAWLPPEAAVVVANTDTNEAGWDAASVFSRMSSWMPQIHALPLTTSGLNPLPSKLERDAWSKPKDSQAVPCLSSDQAKLVSICAWLPVSDTSTSSGEASSNDSVLSRLSAWLPQTAPASSSAPKTQHPRRKALELPKVLAPLPRPPPPLPGQCDVDEADQPPLEWQSKQSKQSLLVRESAILSSTDGLTTENYSASGTRTGEPRIRGASYAGGGDEDVHSAGRAAVGGGMHLEPLPRRTPARRPVIKRHNP